MKWENLTVGQFQDIYKLSHKKMDEMEKLEKVISILYNMTEKQVDDLSIGEFTELSKECAFTLNEPIPGKPVKYIKVGKKKYGIQYNPSKLRHRQYVEILHFSSQPIENMHYIMASIVQPIRWGRWGKNEAERHEEVSFDMLNARVIDVYHSCVFFCKLYVNLITAIKGSLIEQMTTKMTRETAETIVSASQSIMGGFIQQGKWQNTKE